MQGLQKKVKRLFKKVKDLEIHEAHRVIRYYVDRKIDPTTMFDLHMKYSFSVSLHLFNILSANPTLDGLQDFIDGIQLDINKMFELAGVKS